MLKCVLFIAFIGHILCGVCDCLLSYSPSGRLDLKGALKSSDKMNEVFKDYPIKKFEIRQLNYSECEAAFFLLYKIARKIIRSDAICN